MRLFDIFIRPYYHGDMTTFDSKQTATLTGSIA